MSPAEDGREVVLGPDDAVVDAFRLIYDIQAATPGAYESLESLVATAERRKWGDVVRTGLFGRAVNAWFTRSGDVSSFVQQLIDQSANAEDHVMLALGLALRADQGFSPFDASLAATRDADLARSIVLLEQRGGATAKRISAHTACGIALGNRALFELSDEQYAMALAIGAEEPPGVYDFLLAPVMFNLAEAQVSWASVLAQLGDDEAVGRRWESWRSASQAAANAFELPEAWRCELEALGFVLAAMAGDRRTAAAAASLSSMKGFDQAAPRVDGLVKLASAIVETSRFSKEAERAVNAALDALDASIHPYLHDLALFLGAKLADGEQGSAGFVYARRQLERNWANRLTALGAMQSRIQAERLSSERELLSKHARLDDLTDIGNRRALEQYLVDLERLDVGTIALTLIDVNDFKSVNDHHGHLAGDAVLIVLARVLEHCVRTSDLAVRLGGDEFAVVLAGADLEAGFERSLGFLTEFDEQDFDAVSPGLTVTLSAGVASGPPTELQELLSRADEALYRAKDGLGQRLLRSSLARPGD